MAITVVLGDLVDQDVDAIVNAANEQLAPGGGVCGAIHRAGGDEIFVEAARIGHCPTGEAILTNAGRLRARHVIHAVGPVWRGGSHGEEALLVGAYRSALRVARDAGCRTVAFPGISTGIYGFPAAPAARLAAEAVAPLAGGFAEVRFVLFDEETRGLFAAAAAAACGAQDSGTAS